ncbi:MULTISPECIES: hypothetical protein [Nocardia]|jgi:hypothetical protein|uniref:hypothetical protein n=1 Tax=Nocardia TaxID=1817 RepID=UPI001895DF59|nr:MULTISPECIES: hypothetical protein [Nocardia]MBF6289318.1 hypothetical protein [Nocardia cyriacigeorgica]MBF6326767.1 hypothetical protein [Nocardia cyriacigeorgica]
MARDPDNVKLWVDAKIYLSDAAVRPALPADVATDFGAEWIGAGILNGEDGMPEERAQEESKFYGWNIGLVKVSSRNRELSRTFSPMEDNPVIRGLVWPGSTATKVPMPAPVYRWIAFETDDDFGARERLIATRQARLWVPSNNYTETDATKWEVQVQLFADGNGDVFDRQIPAVTP